MPESWAAARSGRTHRLQPNSSMKYNGCINRFIEGNAPCLVASDFVKRAGALSDNSRANVAWSHGYKSALWTNCDAPVIPARCDCPPPDQTSVLQHYVSSC